MNTKKHECGIRVNLVIFICLLLGTAPLLQAMPMPSESGQVMPSTEQAIAGGGRDALGGLLIMAGGLWCIAKSRDDDPNHNWLVLPGIVFTLYGGLVIGLSSIH